MISDRKIEICALANKLASVRNKWIKRNAFYHEEDIKYMRFLVPEGLRILDCGCGTGTLLAALKPSYGVGIDFSSEMIKIARTDHPDLEFHIGDIEDVEFMSQLKGQFDVILLSDAVGFMDDCVTALLNLQQLCTTSTRIIISTYSRMWAPALSIAEALKLKMQSLQQDFLSGDDIENILEIADFEIVKREWRLLAPFRIFGIGTLINRYVAPFPLIRRMCLRNYIVARPMWNNTRKNMSVSVIIPCRNERGNIEAAVHRLPQFSNGNEILFIEGHSQDGTLEEIYRVISEYPQYDIKVFVQDGVGKGDAVRKGFSHARGEVLMILDADLTVPPEDLNKFYNVLVTGKGEFINGTRLVYPMEKGAMRFLNYLANKIFSWLFTWLLNQRFTDTLCGTKVLTKKSYQQIAINSKYFGEFDPFGDFDLIFGASKLNLQVVEVPIRYASRTYGKTQISRFRHGWLLLRMVFFAFRKLKAF